MSLHRFLLDTGRWLAFLAVTSLLLGCADEHPFPVLYPVKGKVVHAGKPVEKGHLQLDDAKLRDDMFLVQAQIGAEGAFELTTISAKVKKQMPGAPAGSYRIVFTDPGDGQMVSTRDLPGPFVVEPKENTWSIDLSRK